MKFKNVKKKTEKPQSPSNSRVIPDPKLFSRIYRGSLKFFILITFILAVALVVLDLQENLKTKENIDSQRETLIKELNYWKDFITKHNDYKDAYFEAAILEYRLGNIAEAKEYAKKGLVLDPNSEDSKKIENFLINK